MSIEPNLEKIITILSDGKFHDGSSIGKQLGMTRAGVWKIIQKLGSYGIKIKSVKGRGYALSEPLILLNAKEILSLPTSLAIEIFETIASTKDYLQSYHGTKQLRVCLAEYQTNARGRLERKWHAPFAQNIYLSLLYPFSTDISHLSGLSLVIGLAVCATVNDTYKIQTLVKWPNDIVYKGAKLGGVLIEVQAEANGFCSAVISFGLNVNMVDDDKKIDQSWTSIRKINNQYNDRNVLCSKLITNLLNYIRNFEQHGLDYFVEEWKSKDALMNKTINLTQGNDILKGFQDSGRRAKVEHQSVFYHTRGAQIPEARHPRILKGEEYKYTGKAVGINTQGHLLVELENGETKAFSSGDTTILKNL